MTPKEKAQELVDKFTRSQYYGCLLCGEDYDDKQESAKQGALIAVDEILEFMEVDDFDSDTCYWANHSQMKYWTEVKQEIEKL